MTYETGEPLKKGDVWHGRNLAGAIADRPIKPINNMTKQELIEEYMHKIGDCEQEIKRQTARIDALATERKVMIQFVSDLKNLQEPEQSPTAE